MVITMNKYFIYEYISRIKKEDIVNYSMHIGIELDDNDLEIIYYYLKNEYQRFFNNPQEIFMEIKGKISKHTYDVLLDLYNKYKDKIK